MICKCFSGKWNFVCFSIYAYRPVYAVDSRCEADYLRTGEGWLQALKKMINPATVAICARNEY